MSEAGPLTPNWGGQKTPENPGGRPGTRRPRLRNLLAHHRCAHKSRWRSFPGRLLIMTKRLSIFIYGVVSYAIFFVTYLYAIGFVGNLWVPKSMDSAPEGPVLTALFTDPALLGRSAIQHSVMARPAFKRWWTSIVPAAAERSTYVLFSSVA